MQITNTPSPMSPQDNFVSTQRKKVLVVVGIITAFVVMIILFLLVFSKDTADFENSTGSQKTDNSLEAFAPEPARIGNASILSACRVFSHEDVMTAFGNDFLRLPTVTDEKYHHISLPSTRVATDKNSVVTSCTFSSPGASSYKLVKVEAVQFANAEERNKNITRVSDLQVQSPKELNDMKTRLKDSLSSEGAQFLTDIAKTTQSFVDSNANPTANVASLVEGRALLGVPRTSITAEFTLETYSKNSVISLSVVGSDEKRPVENISDAELSKIIESLQKATGIIHDNMKNTSKLSAPAPTADRKDVPNTNGLAIVDACNILNPKSFMIITGVAETAAIERTTFPILAAQDKTEKITNVRRFETVCTRQFDTKDLSEGYVKTAGENTYGPGGYARVTLEVGHAKTLAVTDDVFKDYRTTSGKVTTKADEAYRNTINPSLAIARKGQYVLFLSVDKMSADGISSRATKTQLPLTDEELTVTINEFVSAIR